MAKSYASRYENNKKSKGDIQRQYIGGQYNGTSGVNGRVSILQVLSQNDNLLFHKTGLVTKIRIIFR
jgi:hypothetical protein